jgi:hypothetical protein
MERVMALDAKAIKPACERARAYCLRRRDEAGAARYLERFNERHRLEVARQEQAQNLDAGHPVEPADLDAEAAPTVQARLRGRDRKGIRSLFLVWRRLPADPSTATYVLGFEPDWWSRRLGRQARITARLAAIQWPVNLIVCSLDGRLRRYRKTLQAAPGSRLF